MGGIPFAARAVQHEAAIHVHRAAAQHRLLADADVGGLELHLRHDVAELHAERLVQHDAECACSLCSQMSTTVCAKAPSVREGIAISR